MLSLVQNIFPEFGILKPEMIILYTSTSTLKQEAVYRDKPDKIHWCSEARGPCQVSPTLACQGCTPLLSPALFPAPLKNSPVRP